MYLLSQHEADGCKYLNQDLAHWPIDQWLIFDTKGKFDISVFFVLYSSMSVSNFYIIKNVNISLNISIKHNFTR